MPGCGAVAPPRLDVSARVAQQHACASVTISMAVTWGQRRWATRPPAAPTWASGARQARACRAYRFAETRAKPRRVWVGSKLAEGDTMARNSHQYRRIRLPVSLHAALLGSALLGITAIGVKLVRQVDTVTANDTRPLFVFSNAAVAKALDSERAPGDLQAGQCKPSQPPSTRPLGQVATVDSVALRAGQR